MINDVLNYPTLEETQSDNLSTHAELHKCRNNLILTCQPLDNLTTILKSLFSRKGENGFVITEKKMGENTTLNTKYWS